MVIKMAICPKCNKKIDRLVSIQSGYGLWEVKIDKDREIEYKWIEFTPNDSINGFDCPECGKTLFTESEEARKFLTSK